MLPYRENGGEPPWDGGPFIIINPINAPSIVGIYWVYPLLKGIKKGGLNI